MRTSARAPITGSQGLGAHSALWPVVPSLMVAGRSVPPFRSVPKSAVANFCPDFRFFCLNFPHKRRPVRRNSLLLCVAPFVHKRWLKGEVS